MKKINQCILSMAFCLFATMGMTIMFTACSDDDEEVVLTGNDFSLDQTSFTSSTNNGTLQISLTVSKADAKVDTDLFEIGGQGISSNGADIFPNCAISSVTSNGSGKYTISIPYSFAGTKVTYTAIIYYGDIRIGEVTLRCEVAD